MGETPLNHWRSGPSLQAASTLHDEASLKKDTGPQIAHNASAESMHSN